MSSIFLVQRVPPAPIPEDDGVQTSHEREPREAPPDGPAPIWALPSATASGTWAIPDKRVDCCVIGAGISGLTVAYMLALEGRRVVVLDQSSALGGGETGRTSAHLSTAIDIRYTEVERIHGEEGARACAESHVTAIDRIEQIAAKERIACDFERVPGYLFAGAGQGREALEPEFAAARRAGLDVKLLERAPQAPFDTGPCLVFPRQAQIHPLRYIHGLAEAIERAGGTIVPDVRVTDVEDGSPVRIHTSDGRIVEAGEAVVATNTPFNNRVAVHVMQSAHRSYVVAVRVPLGSVKHALYWDMADPYHYVRVAPAEPGGHHDILLVGGEDHETGRADDAEERWSKLAFWARLRFPVVGDIVARWSGQIMAPADGVALIGRSPTNEHVFVATGDAGMGLTHGTIAGILISDLVVGRSNYWSDLYDPSRARLWALGGLAAQGAGAIASYRRWITPGDAWSEDDIAPGDGAIIRRGLKKIACHRDDSGCLHEFSAVCPHLGGIVAWNSAERTWDCPSHGSRFSATGQVIHGPAHADLAEARKSPGAAPRGCAGNTSTPAKPIAASASGGQDEGGA